MHKVITPYALGQKGMVLLSTIGIIVMISLLIVTSMQQNALFSKVLARLQRQDKDFYHMEKVARHVLQANIETCLVKNFLTNDWLSQLRKKGCLIVESGEKYRYLIEDIGVFPCWMVNTKEGNKPSHHFNVLIIRTDETPQQNYMQLRDIRAGKSLKTCSGKELVIQSGMQSWLMGSAVVKAV